MMFSILSSLGANFVVLILFVFVYKYLTRNNDYWKKNFIPYEEPYLIFGNCFSALFLHESLGILLLKLYNKYKSPYFGIFFFDNPILVVKDPTLIKAILLKDFNYFYDRSVLSDEKCDSIASKMLFFLKNPEWKNIRSKMTPVFTSGKLKNMLFLMNTAGTSLKNYLNEKVNESSIECKEVCAKFSTDVITSCVFGLEAGSFKNENAEFKTVGRQMFDVKWLIAFYHACYLFAPSFAKLMRMPLFDSKLTSFLRDVFWKTLQQRTAENRRNDLIDVIKDLKNESDSNSSFKIDGDSLLAQATQFFAAGFETTSSTMSFILYELCINPNIQQKLKLEISNTLSQHKELSYDAVQNMKYLDMVVSEALRKYPVVPFLDRMCMNDYQLPNSSFILRKGTSVYISTLGLHHDSTYFPNPEVYDPERFSEENKNNFPNYAYLPFGDGLRNCIGARFALLVTKIGIINILTEFELEKSADTPIPIEFTTKSVFLSPKTDLPIKFKKCVSLDSEL